MLRKTVYMYSLRSGSHNRVHVFRMHFDDCTFVSFFSHEDRWHRPSATMSASKSACNACMTAWEGSKFHQAEEGHPAGCQLQAASESFDHQLKVITGEVNSLSEVVLISRCKQICYMHINMHLHIRCKHMYIHHVTTCVNSNGVKRRCNVFQRRYMTTTYKVGMPL